MRSRLRLRFSRVRVYNELILFRKFSSSNIAVFDYLPENAAKFINSRLLEADKNSDCVCHSNQSACNSMLSFSYKNSCTTEFQNVIYSTLNHQKTKSVL